MGPLGAAEAPGAAFHSADGRAKAGGHNDFMAPRTRALKTVDGAPSSTADKSPGSHRRAHSSGMLEAQTPYLGPTLLRRSCGCDTSEGLPVLCRSTAAPTRKFIEPKV